MKYLITGAGQIASQLIADLTGSGHQTTVLRRSSKPTSATTTVIADAADRTALARAATGAAAIFHCIHARYDAEVWLKELPPREQAVMDIGVELQIPVIFPESVYAFGENASQLEEGSKIEPCSPLGEIRADLLHRRAEHSATTLSLVASDLLGATAINSMAHLLRPRGTNPKRLHAWIPADLDLPHSWTYLADLSAAMIFAAQHHRELAPSGERILHTPTNPSRSIRDLANDLTTAAGLRPARVHAVPKSILKSLR